jgi:hypothetical protein
MESNDRHEEETMSRFFGFTEAEQSRIPVLPEIERRAYQAAWRIDREPMLATVNELSCASTRHARYIDHIARIIQEEMGR